MGLTLVVVVALLIIATGVIVSVRGKRAVQRTGADLDRLHEEHSADPRPDTDPHRDEGQTP